MSYSSIECWVLARTHSHIYTKNSYNTLEINAFLYYYTKSQKKQSVKKAKEDCQHQINKTNKKVRRIEKCCLRKRKIFIERYAICHAIDVFVLTGIQFECSSEGEMFFDALAALGIFKIKGNCFRPVRNSRKGLCYRHQITWLLVLVALRRVNANCK